MKQIIHYLKTYYREEFKWSYFLALVVFLGLCLYFNYKYDFENTYLDSYLYTATHMPLMIGFYAFAYAGAILLYVIFYRRTDFLKKPGFWGVSLLALGIQGINSSFYYLNPIYEQLFDRSTYYFVRKCSNNIKSEVIYFVPLVIYWYLNDRKDQPLYGFSKGRLNLKPYFFLLLLMLPLILWASFQDDFLRRYPTYHPRHDSSDNFLTHFWAYELFYGLDFVGTEFFYRGFMVMALARYLGPGAILPMVSVYTFMHFGKPMGEAVGSFFGGTVLGILAFYSRSIYCGIIIHMGVAYLMEFTSFLQHYLKGQL
ncbi:MAG: CPBP family intramembrane metalloprotease [Pontibacter sp.]|nr:CPBP family intramembrane metalloprotease [Pontibacter sp.]